ncbi:MAG: tyrosine-type recombinase/integrase [Planctomycetes bacterium]|nr:tyrosine-type recombinase/integrase [Planctomycetota bacterium]
MRYYTPDGRRHFASFPTKGQAVEHGKLITTRINSDYFQTITSIPWDKLVEGFIEAKKSKQLSPASIYLYQKILDDFGSVCKKPLSTRITTRSIDLYLQHISHNAPTTVNKCTRHLNAFFTWTVQRKYIVENPITSDVKLREPKKRRQSWTPAEFEKVLDVITDPQWYILAHLAVNGIARKRSIARLTVNDINFEHDTINIYDDKQKEHRLCPLHPETMKALAAYVNELTPGQTKLFTSQFHYATWNKYEKAASVNHLTFHHLRSCMSNWLKQRGVSDALVDAILGHYVGSVGGKYYTNLEDVKTRREGINKLPLPPFQLQSSPLVPAVGI